MKQDPHSDNEVFKPRVVAPERPKKRRWKRFVLICVLGILFLGALFLFVPMNTTGKTAYLYIDRDDTADSVFTKVEQTAEPMVSAPFRLIAKAWGYTEHIRPGRYAIDRIKGPLMLVRQLRNGQQSPVKLVVPSVRTMDRMAGKLAKTLEVDSVTLLKAFRDSALLAQYGVNRQTLPTLFLPNTYETYWTASPEQILKQMKKESDRFWTDERKQQAKAAGLTPQEVITLASIVESETTYTPEKPRVAGMYLNRFRQGMKLQADPTVKFALGDFSLRRILNVHLGVDSPYNTYKYAGLPPGPICVPEVETIEAVLHYEHHNYIFMCAKEDFSGSHNFAATDVEHMANARRYAEALNKRGIK